MNCYVMNNVVDMLQLSLKNIAFKHGLANRSLPVFLHKQFFWWGGRGLTALSRTSYTGLTKSGNKGPSCLIPDPWRKVFCFSPLSMMLVLGGFL